MPVLAAIPAGYLAAAGAAATVVGTAVSAYGASQQADATSDAAKYNSAVAANNETIAKNNATMAAQAGEQQAAVAQQKTRATVGAIKTSEAASGVDVNSGSALDVQSSAKELGELNAITIRSNAAKTAYGYQTQAAGFGDQSQLDKMNAENAEIAGETTTGATILGGLAQGANNWANYKKPRTLDPGSAFLGASP